MTEKEAKTRIDEIDEMFDKATHWGSWMVMLANEREDLATKYGFAHKNLARTSNGRRTN